jgi:hypothetical protein
LVYNEVSGYQLQPMEPVEVKYDNPSDCD